VRAADELQAVGLVEVRADVAAKQVARAARAQAPAGDVLGVGPQQVAHGAIVRHLLLAIDGPDLRARGLAVGTLPRARLLIAPHMRARAQGSDHCQTTASCALTHSSTAGAAPAHPLRPLLALA